jgi:hypothetical protein
MEPGSVAIDQISSIALVRTASGEGATLRIRAGQRGSHQFQCPRIDMLAGARIPRTISGAPGNE